MSEIFKKTIELKGYDPNAPIVESTLVRGIIERDDGAILMLYFVNNGYGYYTFPGGAMNKGETINQALTRTIKEETGFDIISNSFEEVAVITMIHEHLSQLSCGETFRGVNTYYKVETVGPHHSKPLPNVLAAWIFPRTAIKYNQIALNSVKLNRLQKTYIIRDIEMLEYLNSINK